VLPPTYHALKIDAAINAYTSLAAEFTNLRDRFRQAALVSSRKPFPEFEADSKTLFERLEKARGHMLTPPEWCFRLARRKHKDGHYHHDYDERTKDSKASEEDDVARHATPHSGRP
jgi:hypothetical protein